MGYALFGSMSDHLYVEWRMLCDDYQQLVELYVWATHRVAVYEKPVGTTKLAQMNVNTFFIKREAAQAEERSLRLQMEAHLEFCQICREAISNGDEC